MSIDKFGRVLQNEENQRVSYSQVGGLPTTSDGHYNAQNKIIRNLGMPLAGEDAANIDYVNKKTSACLKLKVGGHFDAKNNIIRRVKAPVEKADVVNKEYLESLIPIKLSDGYSLGNVKLKDVAYPVQPGDGVNVQYINNTCVKYENGLINGNNCILANIKHGIEDTDAATIANVKTSIEETKLNIENNLRNLGSALFRYVHRHGRTSTPFVPTAMDSKNIINLDWDKILS